MCLAAEITPAKKAPTAKLQPKTAVSAKKETVKIIPTPKTTSAKLQTKTATSNKKEVPKISPKIAVPKVILPKTTVKPSTKQTTTLQQKAVLAPAIEKKPAMSSTPKLTPEIPVKVQKPKQKSKLENAPPKAQPCAIEKTELKKIAKEAALELQTEENEFVGDLRILWQYAVENSETIKFAIYKLSDPKGDLKNADESKIKKLLKPIAGITPFVAATAANPIAAGSSIIGGTFMNDVLNDDKYKKQFEKVTDADLVILAKAIEDLQTTLVTTYYEYNTSKKILEFADKNLQHRKQLCDSLTNVPVETVVIADTFYREALARQNQAQADLLLKRAALEQLVGNDAILLIENNKTQKR